jgi:hypothetical protein
MKKLVSLFTKSATAIKASPTEVTQYKPSEILDIKQNQGYDLFKQSVSTAIIPNYLNSQALQELNSIINVNEQKILTLKKEYAYTLLPHQEVMYKEAVLDKVGYYGQVSELTYRPEKFGGKTEQVMNFKLRDKLEKEKETSICINQSSHISPKL